jgi:hypothetical protein
VGKITHIKVLGLALFAVFAFSAVMAASSFAVSEWLFNGAAIGNGVELATNTEGTLTLDVLDGTGALLINEIDCSGLFEGTVGAAGVDLVLDLFSLTGTLIEELPGTSLTCETLFDGGACTVGAESLLWVDELSLALGLTWESLIELNGTTFLDHFHHVAFELKCLLLNGATLESLCEGLTSGTLTNVAPNVLLEFGAAAGTESLNCINTVGGVEQELTLVDLEGDLIIKHATGGTLAVS